VSVEDEDEGLEVLVFCVWELIVCDKAENSRQGKQKIQKLWCAWIFVMMGTLSMVEQCLH
jgi:ketosteroid isomerase-like protein